jgi:hypothetical protein
LWRELSRFQEHWGEHSKHFAAMGWISIGAVAANAR